MNKQLSDYSFISSNLPMHISINRITDRFPLHRHDFLECSLVLDGEGIEVVNGHPHALTVGTLSLLLPYQVHEIQANPNAPITMFNCMFDLVYVFELLKKDPAMYRLLNSSEDLPPYVQLVGNEFEVAVKLMQALLEEYVGNQDWRGTLMRLYLGNLMIRFDRARMLNQGEDNRNPPLEGNRVLGKKNRIWNVIHYVHCNYREEIRLSSLANQFGFNASHLSELIKLHMGCNFVEFLHEVRVRQACSLLASTDMNVIDVGFEVGFQSLQSFVRVFKKRRSVTPSKYRWLIL